MYLLFLRNEILIWSKVGHWSHEWRQQIKIKTFLKILNWFDMFQVSCIFLLINCLVGLMCGLIKEGWTYILMEDIPLLIVIHQKKSACFSMINQIFRSLSLVLFLNPYWGFCLFLLFELSLSWNSGKLHWFLHEYVRILLFSYYLTFCLYDVIDFWPLFIMTVVFLLSTSWFMIYLWTLMAQVWSSLLGKRMMVTLLLHRLDLKVHVFLGQAVWGSMISIKH